MGPDPFLLRRTREQLPSNWLTFWLLALIIFVFAARAAAQPTTAPATSDVPDDPLGRGTPRSAVERFIGAAREGDFILASRYLDLSALEESTRSAQGPKLARKLWFVLERRVDLKFDSLSGSAQGDRDDGLPPDRERVARIEWSGGLVSIKLDRQRDPADRHVWMVSTDTVHAIPALYDAFELPWADRLLSEQTVDRLVRMRVLGLGGLTWLTLPLLLAVWAVLAVPPIVLVRRLVRRAEATGGSKARPLLHALYLPVSLLLATSIVRVLTPERVVSAEITWLFHARTLVTVVVIWILFRLSDYFGDRALESLAGSEHHVGFHPIRLLRRVFKVVLVFVGLLLWLDNMGFRVNTILASLGIAGLAVGLASQKFIEDLIAAMTLHATGVVRRNDFIRFGTQRGVVEDVGLRMVTIRSRDRTLITLPNAAFAAMEIENFGRRDKTLYQPRISLRYETSADQLRFILIELRKLLYAHPKVLNDESRVRFAGFGASSLDVDIFCFVSETDAAEFLAVAEDLNLRIMDIVAKAGAGFAFPSQTLYVERGTPPDPERSRQAEEQVRELRQQGEFSLHKLTDKQIIALAGTVKYPDTDGQPTRT